MILLAILALSGVVLAALLTTFGNGLPTLPESVTGLMATLISTIRDGAGLFWSFVHPAPVKAMLGLTAAAVGIYNAYKFTMWIVKKIPMLGVSD